MTSDETRRTGRPFVLPGTGLPSYFSCMGCGKPSQPLGSRGVGALKRCSFCVAAKAAGSLLGTSSSAPISAGVGAPAHSVR